MNYRYVSIWMNPQITMPKSARQEYVLYHYIYIKLGSYTALYNDKKQIWLPGDGVEERAEERDYEKTM